MLPGNVTTDVDLGFLPDGCFYESMQNTVAEVGWAHRVEEDMSNLLSRYKGEADLRATASKAMGDVLKAWLKCRAKVGYGRLRNRQTPSRNMGQVPHRCRRVNPMSTRNQIPRRRPTKFWWPLPMRNARLRSIFGAFRTDELDAAWQKIAGVNSETMVAFAQLRTAVAANAAEAVGTA